MKYRAHAQRNAGDQWWAITVEDQPGVFSQARRLDQVAGMTADALSLWLEREVTADDVEVVPHVPDIDEAISTAREARRVAEEANAHAAAAMRRVAVIAADEGLKVRDIGELLDVSYQRASVLVREGRVAVTKVVLPASVDMSKSGIRRSGSTSSVKRKARSHSRRKATRAETMPH